MAAIQQLLSSYKGGYSNPETNLGTPTRTLSQGNTWTPPVSGAFDVFIAVDVNALSTSSIGILFEIGGNAGAGSALGVLGSASELRIRAFVSTSTGWQQSGSAWAIADFSSYMGDSGTLYTSINYTAGTVKLYWMKGGPASGNEAILIGSGTGGTGTAFGTNGAGVGVVNSSVADLGFTGDTSSFNGTINQFRMWENTPGPIPIQ